MSREHPIIVETRVPNNPNSPEQGHRVVHPVTSIPAVVGLSEILSEQTQDNQQVQSDVTEVLERIGSTAQAENENGSLMQRIRAMLTRFTLARAQALDRLTDARAQALDRIGNSNDAANSGVTAGISLFARIRHMMTEIGTLISRLTAARATNLDNLNVNLNTVIGPVNATGGTTTAGGSNAKLNEILRQLTSSGVPVNVSVQRGSLDSGAFATLANVPISSVNLNRSYLNPNVHGRMQNTPVSARFRLTSPTNIMINTIANTLADLDWEVITFL